MNECLEERVCLVGDRQPRLEFLRLEHARLHEYLYGHVNYVGFRVRILPDGFYLLALFKMMEKHFGRFCSQKRAAEKLVVVVHDHCVGNAVICHELDDDFANHHGRVPTRQIRRVGHFVPVIDCIVEHREAGTIDVDEQKEVVAITFKKMDNMLNMF